MQPSYPGMIGNACGMTRPLPQPDRETIPEHELEAFDAVVQRQRNRGRLDADGRVPGYFGALMNSPAMAQHLSDFGRTVRSAADRPGTFSLADREWVDMVLSSDWKSNTVLEAHIPDALVRGVRLDAIIALREGREHDLTDDERLLATYIRRVRDGAVDDELWERMQARLGPRGVTDYTIFIMFLVMTIRLIEALTGDKGLSDDEVDRMLREYKDGTRPLPTEILLGAG
jgi:hypothetical protein